MTLKEGEYEIVCRKELFKSGEVVPQGIPSVIWTKGGFQRRYGGLLFVIHDLHEDISFSVGVEYELDIGAHAYIVGRTPFIVDFFE